MERRYYKIEPNKNGIAANTEYAQKVTDDVLWLVGNCSDKICIDVTGVASMTVKFAALSFGRIWSNLGDAEYNKRIEVVGGDENVTIAVEMGINQVFSRKTGNFKCNAEPQSIQPTSKDAMRMVVGKIYRLHSEHIERINGEIRKAAENGLTRTKVHLPLGGNATSAIVVYYKEHGFGASQEINNGDNYIRVSWCDTELAYK
jgi:gamma-glutamylcyclotransferase (GGCT)/AIG2-like uncharacterized protein YtfP